MKFDIAFLGSGISCSQTLLQLLDKLNAQSGPQKKIKIAVVEKEGEFWKGIAYGKRSSVNSLIITTLGEFIPPDERESFLSWMKKSKSKWLGLLKTHGGETAQHWIKNNKDAITKGDFESIYIPRVLYGIYLDERIVKTIEKAEKKEKVVIKLIKAEAIDLALNVNEEYEINLESSTKKSSLLVAKKVVLAIGSGLNKTVRHPKPDETGRSGSLYVNDVYYPSLELHIKHIRSVLSGIKDHEKRNILILGTNASSLETLYLIDTASDLKEKVNKIVAISYSGKLPNRITENSNPKYQFENLLRLKKEKNYSSSELFDTINKDIDIAYQKGVHIGDMYYPLSDLVVELLSNLSEEQEKHFYWNYGIRFTKLIRRAGSQYRDAAQELIDTGKLVLLKGIFRRLKKVAKSSTDVDLEFTSVDDKTPIAYPLSFPIVINCGGFEDLNESSSRLIANLVKKRICKINKTKRGFMVAENLEANKNLFVIGPLLGGIFNSKVKFWHVENLKRIQILSSMLKDTLTKDLE